MSTIASGEPDAAAPEDDPQARRKPWRDPVCIEYRTESAELAVAPNPDSPVLS